MRELGLVMASSRIGLKFMFTFIVVTSAVGLANSSDYSDDDDGLVPLSVEIRSGDLGDF